MANQVARIGNTNNGRFYITEANQTGLDLTGDFTMMCWIKNNATPNQAGLMSRWVGGNISFQWRMISNSSTILYLSSNNSSVGSATRSITNANDEWHHWTITYDASASQIEVFKDAVSEGTATGTLPSSIYNGAADFVFGGAGAGASTTSQYGDAYVAYARIWPSVLTSGEIDTEKDSRTAVKASPALDVSFNGNALDASSNGNDLTAYGSPTYHSGDDPISDTAATFTPKVMFMG